MQEHVLIDLLIILAAGLAANLLCQRVGVSTIVGYLLAGVVLGEHAACLKPAGDLFAVIQIRPPGPAASRALRRTFSTARQVSSRSACTGSGPSKACSMPAAPGGSS